jgi:hypothetical protein
MGQLTAQPQPLTHQQDPSSVSTLVDVDVGTPALEKRVPPYTTTEPAPLQPLVTDSPVATVVARNAQTKSKSRSFPLPAYVPPAHTNRTLVLCFDGTGDQFSEEVRPRCVDPSVLAVS